MLTDQYFFYQRTQHLLARTLIPRRQRNWRQAYYLLLDDFVYKFHSRILSDDLVVSILLEIEYDIPISANFSYVCQERSVRKLINNGTDLFRWQTHISVDVT